MKYRCLLLRIWDHDIENYQAPYSTLPSFSGFRQTAYGDGIRRACDASCVSAVSERAGECRKALDGRWRTLQPKRPLLDLQQGPTLLATIPTSQTSFRKPNSGDVAYFRSKQPVPTRLEPRSQPWPQPPQATAARPGS